MIKSINRLIIKYITTFSKFVIEFKEMKNWIRLIQIMVFAKLFKQVQIKTIQRLIIWWINLSCKKIQKFSKLNIYAKICLIVFQTKVYQLTGCYKLKSWVILFLSQLIYLTLAKNFQRLLLYQLQNLKNLLSLMKVYL